VKTLLGSIVILACGLVATVACAADRWETLPPPQEMPVPNQSGLAHVGDIDMYYAEFGQGEPVLLIHGGLANSDFWASQVRDLSADHLVIIADSRGHGRSTRTETPFSYDLMTADYLALLDHLHIRKTKVVGWSDGGIIALDLARAHPDRVSKVVAQAANYSTAGVRPDVMENKTVQLFDEMAKTSYEKLSATPNEFPQLIERISTMWSTQPEWGIDDLQKIQVPVTVVLGDHDEAIRRDHTEEMVKAIPGANLVILKDVSHFAMLQDPDGYNRLIRNALDHE
jgi:pimeloyl-ACP methyl ester carboxylesterase